MLELDFSDWSYLGNSEREETVMDFLQELFTDFWIGKQLDKLSSGKQSRYLRYLNLLGEILVECAVGDPSSPEAEMTPHELFMANVNESEGPLFYQDNEKLQEEFDLVCGKVYCYLLERESDGMRMKTGIERIRSSDIFSGHFV